MYTAGIDIGGTNIKFGIFDSEMNCVHTELAKSVRGDSLALARQIKYLIDQSPVKPPPRAFSKRYSMAASCSRVTGASGAKTPGATPLLIPSDAAQRTASAYQLSVATSPKGSAASAAGCGGWPC